VVGFFTLHRIFEIVGHTDMLEFSVPAIFVFDEIFTLMFSLGKT